MNREPESVLSSEALFRGIVALHRHLNEMYQLRVNLDRDLLRGELLMRTRLDLLLESLQPVRTPPMRDSLPVTPPATMLSLDDVMREAVMMAMDQAKGKKLHAARLMGIPRSRMYRMLERYKLMPPPRPRGRPKMKDVPAPG